MDVAHPVKQGVRKEQRMNQYHDPKIEFRVEELLCQMTLEEKAAQMVQVPYAYVPREEALLWARRGAGSAGIR